MTYPSFYKDFKCIADRCRHSCCVGWDVDIDEDTYKKYLSLSSDLGEKIRSNIYIDEEGAHFGMQNGRCPFLNESGLCDIITALGDGALCDICSLHPRFVNYFDDREEWGLGLCCEEAARLTLLNEEPFTLENDGVDGFCIFRQRLLGLLWEDGSINEKAEKILSACGVSFPQKTLSEWADILSSLERLDNEWDDTLKLLYENSSLPLKNDLPFLQLFSYFLYRHLDPEDLALTAAFCYFSYFIIREIFVRGEQSPERLCEIARAYSAEIEYSTENIASLFDFLLP